MPVSCTGSEPVNIMLKEYSGLLTLSEALLPVALFSADKAEGEKFSEPKRTTDNAVRRKEGPGPSGTTATLQIVLTGPNAQATDFTLSVVFRSVFLRCLPQC